MFHFLASLPAIVDTLVRDGGPIYRETNLAHTIAEPWNAISSLAFIVPVFYWLYRLRGQYSRYAFLVGCMPLLALGSLGSTFFHAFRTSRVLLFMDFMPIIILTLALGIYLWYRVLRNWWGVAAVTAVFTAPRFLIFQYLDRMQAINTAYFISGCMIFIPAIIFLYRTRFTGFGYLILAVVMFLIALLFRYTDNVLDISFLPMGTHWLWHLFCGLGAMPLSYYLVRIVDLKSGIEIIKEGVAD
jgi:hypothetical protein